LSKTMMLSAMSSFRREWGQRVLLTETRFSIHRL